MEKKTVVRPIQVDFTCGECENGVMIATGEALMCYPPIYLHKCDSCGSTGKYRTRYPEIRYEPYPKV